MNSVLFNVLIGLLSIVVGYIFGSIPFSIVIGKVFFKKDPRDYGSKNAGATNVGRVFGKKIGVIVLILDALKSLLPLWIMYLIFTFVKFNGQTLLPTAKVIATQGYDGYLLKYPAYWLTALGVAIGHCYPCLAGFKGGKGAASLLGTTISTTWMFILIPLPLFIALIKKTKYMSLSVIVSFTLCVLLQWIYYFLLLGKVIPTDPGIYLPGYGQTLVFGLTSSIVMTLCVALCIIRHRSNIKRLIDGNERKVNIF